VAMGGGKQTRDAKRPPPENGQGEKSQHLKVASSDEPATVIHTACAGGVIAALAAILVGALKVAGVPVSYDPPTFLCIADYKFPGELLALIMLIMAYHGGKRVPRRRRAAVCLPAEKEIQVEKPKPEKQAERTSAKREKKNDKATPAPEADGKGKSNGKGANWRKQDPKTEADASDNWRSNVTAGERKEPSKAEINGRPVSAPSPPAKEERPALFNRGLSAVQLERRGIINKICPDKFERLCAQLLDTLPIGAVMSTVVDDIVALVFEAASRQHQYIDMYTDLVAKLKERIQNISRETNTDRLIWNRCTASFDSMCLKPLAIPDDYGPEDMDDLRGRHKNKMVGTVKLGGQLACKGLVPTSGIIGWIQELLAIGNGDSQYDSDLGDGQGIASSEMHIEAALALLGGIGPSLSDSSIWSQEEQDEVEDIFCDLETMVQDDEAYSKRLRCLIQDCLELRDASWKERDGLVSAKPTVLTRDDNKSDDDSNLDMQAASSVLANLAECKVHMAPQDEKFGRLVDVIQSSGTSPMLIYAAAANTPKLLSQLEQTFDDRAFGSMPETGPDNDKRGGKSTLLSFEGGRLSVLVLTFKPPDRGVSRKDAQISRTPGVLVVYDMPSSVKAWLHRVGSRGGASTVVHTFFDPQADAKLGRTLGSTLRQCRLHVPEALARLSAARPADKRPRRNTAVGGWTPANDSTRPRAPSKWDAKGDRGKPRPRSRTEADEGETERRSNGAEDAPWRLQR